MFYWVIVIITIISFFMAVLSLRKMGQKKEIDEAKRELSKGKVIYREDYSSADSSSSSTS